MKIFSTEQMRWLDQYTIDHEPILSIDLMERAAACWVRTFVSFFDHSHPVHIVCGLGNNGGDGLAIARMLHSRNYKCRVYIARYAETCSEDFLINYKRLDDLEMPVNDLNDEKCRIETENNAIIIDALFGCGLKRPIEGWLADFVEMMNDLDCSIVAVDMPSGLFADKISGGALVKCYQTFSFQSPKLCFMLPEAADYLGDWRILNIGLHSRKMEEIDSPYSYLTQPDMASLLKKRRKFGHKGTFGHGLVLGGSFGMIGAPLLTARACLKVGSGLVSIHLPACGYSVAQAHLPEAMVSVDDAEKLVTEFPDLSCFSAIGLGPGLGRHKKTAQMLKELLETAKIPLVIDADALNIIAEKKWLGKIPTGSILTPHPKELERLIGPATDSLDQLKKTKELAYQIQSIVLIKRAHTAIVLPNGNVFFNSTGNPYMATAGSGDVLTGMITGFLAQGYDIDKAAKLGVYFHGLAGDCAHKRLYNFTATEMIEHIRIEVG